MGAQNTTVQCSTRNPSSSVVTKAQQARVDSCHRVFRHGGTGACSSRRVRHTLPTIEDERLPFGCQSLGRIALLVSVQEMHKAKTTSGGTINSSWRQWCAGSFTRIRSWPFSIDSAELRQRCTSELRMVGTGENEHSSSVSASDGKATNQPCPLTIDLAEPVRRSWHTTSRTGARRILHR